MVTAEAAGPARERLEAALRPALGDPGAAPRLACLLAGRARFRARVGSAPGGVLAELPAPFDGLAVPSAAREAMSGIDDGPIGEGYEAALGAEARDARGQYFTPEPIADALVAWALDTGVAGPPTVLDPAVGTGAFLRAAYGRLSGRHPELDADAILGRLYGVDVDGVALQLAGLRLGAEAGVPDPAALSLRRGSFLDLDPGDLPPVDSVVGNPPFVRAESLEPGVGHFRAHLAEIEGPTDWAAGGDALSRRSDAYVYFVTQSTRFLRPGGRLALVLPTKWLMSAYGEDLRRFLREQYRVHAVVGSDGRAFDDALVDTALLLAEHDPDAGASDPLRFVRTGGPVETERLADSGAADALAVKRRQSTLIASGSLARYLEVPAELLELLEGPSFARLDALADVSRGTMTGANRFFFVDIDDVGRFGIEDRFLRPAVKSLRSIERPAVETGDLDRWLIDAHPVVSELSGAADAAAAKAALADAGQRGLLSYVEHAEGEGWHEGRTCRSRRVWFDLGELNAPAAFVPKLLRERVFTVANDAGAVPSNAIDGVWPAEGVRRGALLAALNSSVGRAAMEVTGRDEAGLLQLMTYETASLPTLDVRGLEPSLADRLSAAGGAYAEAPGDRTLTRLDAAVDAAFDLELAPGRLRALTRELRRRRLDA